GSIATNHVPGRDAERALPQDLALGADAKEHQVLVPAAGQEEMVVPDSRRASSHARKRQLPGDILGAAPADRRVLFLGDAVVLGTAPARPIVGPAYGRPTGQDGARGQVYLDSFAAL